MEKKDNDVVLSLVDASLHRYFFEFLRFSPKFDAINVDDCILLFMFNQADAMIQ